MNLKASEVKGMIKSCFTAKRPLFITGSPGIGKSQVMAQAAQELGVALRDVRATLLDPVDLRGLPRVEGNRTHWAPPSFLPTEGSGILFFDELNAAPQSVQVACYQLILDRRIGEYTLPDGWITCGAGNALSDGAAAGRMSSALCNRFVHAFSMIADLEDWLSWAIDRGIKPEIMGFLKWKPTALHDHSRDVMAFPSPRSWEFLSQLLETRPPKTVELALVEGCVGAGVTKEFYAYLEQWRELPNIEAILKDPKKHKAPEKPSLRYAISYALAARANSKNFGQVMAYMKQLPPEYQVLCCKAASQRDAGVCANADFAEFLSKNGGLFQ